MAVKSPDEFRDNKGNVDYQAYANYLESAECADDEGYDIFVDEKGNIYERTDGSWQVGHGHKNAFATEWQGREPNDSESYGRDWHNIYAILKTLSKLSFEELQLVEKVHPNSYIRISAKRLLQQHSNNLDLNDIVYQKTF